MNLLLGFSSHMRPSSYSARKSGSLLKWQKCKTTKSTFYYLIAFKNIFYLPSEFDDLSQYKCNTSLCVKFSEVSSSARNNATPASQTLAVSVFSPTLRSAAAHKTISALYLQLMARDALVNNALDRPASPPLGPPPPRLPMYCTGEYSDDVACAAGLKGE